ncbi:porin family protein [Hyphobacterium sp. CCMP332]|uniref:porin family protein n=1 Tax=Hyphobacterium sp. CCMP332 TaxID=2749086 RepID=UPI00164FC854|nr:porin family protein [Hyphobacterium sp. CCMP332]QNL19446.1 porin family protein [Hyphobacterium sp. CCMP332]
MLRTLVSASALALAAASASFAGQGNFTYGIGYSTVNVTDSTASVDVGAVTLRGDYQFTRHFGFEGQVDFGVSDDTIIVANTPVDVELNYAISGFVIARAPVSENANLFARVGYATADVGASVPGVSITDSLDGFGFGVGGEYFFDARNGFRVDYTNYDFGNSDANVYGITYVRRFGGGR